MIPFCVGPCYGISLVLSRVSRLAALGAATALAVPILASAPLPVAAADNPWAPAVLAPEARVGAVWSFSAQPENPLIVLAATQNVGLIRSVDGGAHWGQPAGAPTQPLWVVAFDPFTPGVAYAGSQGAGIFKSSDVGLTWTLMNTGLANLDVRALDFGKGLVAAATGKGVFVSQDGGAGWRSQGLAEFAVSSVGVYVKNPPYALLAGVDNALSQPGYLFKNLNLAGTWSSASEQDGRKTGFPTDSVVAAIAVGPLPAGAEARLVLVGTHLGLYRSDDGAKTFSAVSGLPNLGFNTLVFNPNSADQVLAGSDGGGAGGGAYRSVDRGASWTPIMNGLPNHDVVGLGLSATRPAQVLAGLWDPAGRSVALYRYPDPALVPSAGAGEAPSASPRPSAPRPSAVASGPPVSRGASVDPRARLWGLAAVVLAAVGVLLFLARRRRMAREDRLTRE